MRLPTTGRREPRSAGGRKKAGGRSAVTGGAQMDGFIDLFTELITRTRISKQCIFRKKAVELPGFFRPTKEWDILVVSNHTLIAAIEAKSQVGPSFGNNFNNRTEEAMGSALDLWTAFRERAYLESPQPFLGYFFMLEDCEASNRPVGVQESHFKVFPEFLFPAAVWSVLSAMFAWPDAISGDTSFFRCTRTSASSAADSALTI